MTVESHTQDYHLCIKNISKAFLTLPNEGGSSAHKDKPISVILQDVNLEWKTGEVIGLIGLNGSGKTTMLNILSGYQIATSGLISCVVKGDSEDAKIVKSNHSWFEGKFFKPETNLTGDVKIAGKLRQIVSSMFSGDLINTELNLVQIVKNNLAINNIALDERRFAYYSNMLNIDDRYFKFPAGTYSKGMKQKTNLLGTILLNKPFLILDEPFVGLDAPSCTQLKQTVVTLARKERKGLLVTAHNMNDLAEICDRIYCLDGGLLSKPIFTRFFKTECFSINIYMTGSTEEMIEKQRYFALFDSQLREELGVVNDATDGTIITYLENNETACISIFIANIPENKEQISLLKTESFAKLLSTKLDLKLVGKATFFNLNAMAKILERDILK